MNHFNEDLPFMDKKEKSKKKKKKNYSSHFDEYDRKSKIFKNINEEEYLKPVKFVSGGFLNDKKKKLIEGTDLYNYSSDNESDDYEEYNVFKNFTFNFNFEVKNGENDYVKDNLKKYNLTELRENDKIFEKYGLGFKILKKMGYEDGIGNKIKTNIVPIEIKKKDIKVLEEKSNESENYNNYYNADNYLNESYDFIFDENIDINNLWKKKFSGKNHWNFNKRKNELNIDLKYNYSYISNEFMNHNNYESNDNDINNLQKAKESLNEHIEKIRSDYFSVMKKRKETDNKLKNYKNYVNKNDIYKIQELILKNILTYKYLLNLHTLLSYPFLFNSLTYNQYLFDIKNYKVKIKGSDSENTNICDQEISHECNMFRHKNKQKLINVQGSISLDQNNIENIDECENQLNDNFDNFEEKLNNLLISKYKLLCKSGYFKKTCEESNNLSDCNVTYNVISNLREVYNLINIEKIEIKKKNVELLFRDLYTFLFFIYENSEFLCLNGYVSNFFLEFLRVYFYNNQGKINLKEKSDHNLYSVKYREEIKIKNHQNSLNKEPKKNVVYENIENQKNYENFLYCSNNNEGKYNEEDIKYLIHFKKIILMGIDENNKTEYNRIENEFDNIIYYNLIYISFYKESFNEFFNYIKHFKDALNKNYYKKILIHFIKKRIMKDIINKESDELNEDMLKYIENKLYILFEINKQFDIDSYINDYYTNFIFIYLQRYDISENYIKLIKCSIQNNMYKKEIYESIIKKIIYHIKDIKFTGDEFLKDLNKILILYDCIDINIISFIFKVYFFFNFSKYVCNYLRDINFIYGKKDETKENINEIKSFTEQNITKEQEKEILTIKKKEIYETFKKVKHVFENNLIKDDAIKNIMFYILNVIKTYIVQDKIITFPVEKVLNFDKNKIFSDDNLNYYFLYKDLKIPIPLYAVPQKNHIYEVNHKNNKKNINFKEESSTDYKFSKKKYINLMNKLENNIKEFKNVQQNYENMNVKNYLEKYCLENNILFLQKNDRKINGNIVYSINNFSIYINNNIIYIYQDYEWKPTLLSDLLKKISKTSL
ncbi:conserved Plasmodium protein, unknown function [Plasmodium relictum]|uniref:G-patch domain-containing protein n=1 Tax=Plasmodium relictum TaxID=85471 RepID=A0A1J1H729_PLARL|nr:conserved Plasmodium protein, unknown function [Plasmodium relictum]CRH00349.1 conserved Plasmodium protein, unknown function [Plasmodium relictum]